jgi:hypothetical protein
MLNYGDLHLHTNHSIDAYLVEGINVDPGEAYHFAKGEALGLLLVGWALNLH